MMVDEKIATKEYYKNHPEKSRRGQHPGRRDEDYEVCPFHEGKCAADAAAISTLCAKVTKLDDEKNAEVEKLHTKIDNTNARILGRRLFLGLLIPAIVIVCGMLGWVMGKHYSLLEDHYGLAKTVAVNTSAINRIEPKIDSIILNQKTMQENQVKIISEVISTELSKNGIKK